MVRRVGSGTCTTGRRLGYVDLERHSGLVVCPSLLTKAPGHERCGLCAVHSSAEEDKCSAQRRRSRCIGVFCACSLDCVVYLSSISQKAKTPASVTSGKPHQLTMRSVSSASGVPHTMTRVSCSPLVSPPTLLPPTAIARGTPARSDKMLQPVWLRKPPAPAYADAPVPAVPTRSARGREATFGVIADWPLFFSCVLASPSRANTIPLCAA